jgi:hypothetical protein
MDLDKDDLAVLCAGMTKDEVDRVHRLLHEWSVGPADSFPSQLSLLTLAQLRAGAGVPRAIADSRKWLEQHLAEYRRQTQLLLDGFNQMVQNETREFGANLLLRANTIENAARQIQARHEDAEFVAKHIKSLMERAACQWELIKTDTKEQCKRLEEVSNDLQNRCAWRVMLQWVVFFLLVLGIGVLAGHFIWTR